MKKKHVFRKILLSFFGILIAVPIFAVFLFAYETKDAKLDMSLFSSSKNAVAFSVCDEENNNVDLAIFGDKQLDISTLPSHVKNAFIAVEDKRFYSHSGVDYKRMAGALLKNIKSRKFSEGASTITQQLIKNTHLSREKTVTRKMKEIKLAIKAEKVFSKDKILEEYLNTIYFGNGAYGIENASELYFSKPAKDLSIAESATLAGVINAPRIYDPISSQERCKERRNLVLKLMQNQNYISLEEYEKNAKTPINIVKNDIKTLKYAKKCIIQETCDALNVTENQLKNMHINIKCSIDFSLQKDIDNLLLNESVHVNGEDKSPASIGVFVVDNKTKNVVAVAGFGGMNFSSKRQPGSLIKPILVYAPALEKGQISPETILKDEPICIDGYSPSNASKTFMGNVSAKVALEKSLNIPAVKVLSNIGVPYAKNFASNIGIQFDEKDTNLALALGGMTNGVTLKQLADAYSTFATNGEFCKSSFVSEIVSDTGKVLYSAQKNKTRSMKTSTAFLISDMLKGTVKNGTARRLSGFNFDLSAKTGTVGVPSSHLNTDAYTACFTTDHTIICYYGANSKSGNLPSSVNGASYPANLTKEVLKILYQDSSPQSFIVPDDVVSADIDTRTLSSGKVTLANPSTQSRYKRTAYFDKNNLPPYSTELDAFVPTLQVEMEQNQKPTLLFEAKGGFTFTLIRSQGQKQQIVYEVVGNGKKIDFTDQSAKQNEIYEYQLYAVSNTIPLPKTKSNTIKLKSF